MASVGMGQATAAERGVDAIASMVELSDTPRAGTDGESDGEGLLVLTADRERRVLVGAAAMGPHVDEWIGQATLAIHADVPLSVLSDLVYPFPTYSEAFGPALEQLMRQIG